MQVSWTQFDTYMKCPLWHSWSYNKNPSTKPPGSNPNPRTGQFRPWTKDTQHLVRGNSSQWIVDAWANQHWYLEDEKTQLALLESHMYPTIHRAMEEGHTDGIPDITPQEVYAEVFPNLKKVLPLLTFFHKKINPDPLTRQPPRAQYEVTSPGPYDTRLLAVTDLVFFDAEERAVIMEGKSTRKPSAGTHDQLRWQMEIFKGGNKPVQDEHFYLYYSTGQFWSVKFSDPQHPGWVGWRNEQLLELVNGNSIPTPGVFECRICPHSSKCPWKYEAKKRVVPAISITHIGTRTRSLD